MSTSMNELIEVEMTMCFFSEWKYEEDKDKQVFIPYSYDFKRNKKNHTIPNDNFSRSQKQNSKLLLRDQGQNDRVPSCQSSGLLYDPGWFGRPVRCY